MKQQGMADAYYCMADISSISIQVADLKPAGCAQLIIVKVAKQ